MLSGSRRWLLAIAAAALGAALWLSGLLAPDPARAPEPARERIEAPLPPPQDVLVRFKDGLTPGRREAVRRDADTRFEEALPVRNLQLVDPDPGLSAQAAAARLERSRDVLYAEPDFARAAAVTPNDTYYDLLWGLHNTGQSVAGTTGRSDADMDGPEAWDGTTGSSGITVGVVDSGVAYGHADLAGNIWRNPDETGGGKESNGVDDDGNGLVDDTRGWDWVDRDNVPRDLNGHGTHVAGTIGARGNDGVGVAGVAWQVGLMPLRVLDAAGSGRVSDVIAAYAYAGRRQIRVVNASLGGGSFSQAEYDAIRAAPATLFVVAAGNEGADNDTTGSYPCNHDLPNVICVAATDQADALADFSNFGRSKVDLAAPGVNIASTWPDGGWAYLDGTSMATPHVAGAAALAWARRPDATVAAIRDALLANVDPLPGLAGRTTTGGRINAQRVVAALSAAGSEPSAATGEPQPAAPSTTPAPALSSQPPPAPAPAAGSAPDRSAPRLSLRFAATARVRAALRSGVRVRVGCSEPCTVRLELALDRRSARRLGLGSGRRAVVIARGRGGRASAGTSLVRLTFTRAARRGLARIRSTRVELRARALDRAGNARSLERPLRLRR